MDGTGAVLAESEPITVNVTDAPVRWQRDDFAALKGKPVKFRFELSNAKLYALGGVALLDPKLPEIVNPIRSRPLTPIAKQTISFDTDAQLWKGVDEIEHHADGGAKGGYITAKRGKGLVPFVHSPVSAKDSPLVGDWSRIFGGHGAMLSAEVRTPTRAGRVKFEIFANDVAQWAFTSTALGEGWTLATAKLRYDWTDAEAKAAGWVPSPTGFSWADTITHVGKVVIIRTPDGVGDRLDVDEFSVSGDE